MNQHDDLGMVRPVQAAGVSVWLDDLDRSRLTTGNLAELVTSGVITGVTTNPAIFAKAISHGGDAYSAALDEAASLDWSADDTVHRLVVADVQAACDVLRPVYDATDGVDGFVSIEVDPRFAHDTAATIRQANELWAEVARPNVMIKIPGTLEGLPAISSTLGSGINVNVTLIFSRERYTAVRAAHREGLSLAHANGQDLSRIASVASFFVSRLDTAIDPLLGNHPLAGNTAVANALDAFADFTADLDTAEWRALHEAGAQEQRPLWASTGTKNAAYSPIKYVEELLTPRSVNTMPAATLAALREATDLAPVAAPLSVADVLAGTEVVYSDVVAQLERDGVAAFVDAWIDLINDVDQSLINRRQT